MYTVLQGCLKPVIQRWAFQMSTEYSLSIWHGNYTEPAQFQTKEQVYPNRSLPSVNSKLDHIGLLYCWPDHCMYSSLSAFNRYMSAQNPSLGWSYSSYLFTADLVISTFCKPAHVYYRDLAASNLWGPGHIYLEPELASTSHHHFYRASDYKCTSCLPNVSQGKSTLNLQMCTKDQKISTRRPIMSTENLIR